MLNEYPSDRIDEVLLAATLRHAPVAITCRSADLALDTWQNCRSHLVVVGDERLWIEQPLARSGQAPPELAIGQKIGVSLVVESGRLVFTSWIVEISQFQPAPGAVIRVIHIARPRRVHQLQRRSLVRVVVPAFDPVDVAIWKGSATARPADSSEVLSGQMLDLSAGGFRVRLSAGSAPQLAKGEPVGADLSFDGGATVLRVDARCRYAARDPRGVLLGMEFVGLSAGGETHVTLERIVQYQDRFRRLSVPASAVSRP